MSTFHPPNPHDHFFRRTFDVLENLRALLKSQLPVGLLAQLDLNSIQPAKDTFLGSEEHEKRLDLLYTARLLDGTEVLIYLLLEHKSWVDRRIALQLFGYVLRILEWRDRNGQAPCVVVPLVVYHGEQAWDEPLSLRDKVSVPGDLRVFVPDMKVVFVDLGRLESVFLLEAPELEARVRALQFMRSRELVFDSVAAIFKLLQDWEKIHSQMEALNDIIIYLYTVFDGQNLEFFQRAFLASQRVEGGNRMPNCLEALFERGLEQGLEQGLERGLGLGIEKGVVIGRIRALQEVVGQPVAAQDDLMSQSLEELQRQSRELELLLRQGLS